MSYVDIVSDLVENYVYCYDKKNYYSPTNKDFTIVGDNPFIWNEFLCYNFYRLDNDIFFGNQEVLPYLRENLPKKSYLRNHLDTDDKVIFTKEFHPYQGSTSPLREVRETFFDVFFQNEKVLKKMRNGTFFMVIYRGWEPELMNHKFSKDCDLTWEKLLASVLSDYNLPHNSIILCLSNTRGYEQEHARHFKKDYFPKRIRPRVVWDNFLEFTCLKKTRYSPDINYNYTIDEHIENLRNSDKTLLRIHRTHSFTRDLMLYYLYQRGYEKHSLIEHAYVDIDSLRKFFSKDNQHSKLHGIDEHLKIFKKLKKDTPIKCSDFENNRKLLGTSKGNRLVHEDGYSYSDTPIDSSVYSNTIFSWASTTFPDQDEMILIGPSTFAPMLNYHPILWLGNRDFIKHLKSFGYKSFDWLFDESYDDETADWSDKSWKKMINQVEQLDKIMSMDRDKLIDIVEKNKDTLQHNRDLLFECKSIERILTKLHGIINETKL